MTRDRNHTSSGVIAWMANHGVAPNLLMLFLIVGGVIGSFIIRKEVYPDHEFNAVRVYVFQSGATPTEMETAVVQPIENAISDLDGIKEINAVAMSSGASVVAKLENNADVDAVMREIENEVNRVNLPKEAEKPRITRSQTRRQSMELILYGNVDPLALRKTSNEVKDSLLRSDYLSQVELYFPPKSQIKIHIDSDTLQRHSLTLEQVARSITNQAISKSGGRLETNQGDILIHVDQLKYWASEFEPMVIAQTAGGTLRLGDIATVSDGFADKKALSFYNGQPSASIVIYRTGDQTPVGISDHVHQQLPYLESLMQTGISLAIVNDDAIEYRQRMSLLLENAFVGLLLVLLILSLFLEWKVAFWVVVGIPTSFLGAALFLPGLDVSFNMISMFAFIIALGIVVDDAIIVGENIYENLTQGMSYQQAAIEGAREICVPLTFSILTNIIAFIPIWFLPGTLGKMFQLVPIVVGLVFLISWVEALVILPAHLAHSAKRQQQAKGSAGGYWHWLKQRIDTGFERLVFRGYRRLLEALIPMRYLVLVASSVALAVAVAFAVGGNIGFSTMPRVEAQFSNARAVLPVGMSLQDAERVRKRLEHSAQQVIDAHGGETLATGISSILRNNDGEFVIVVRIFLTPSELRSISTREVSKVWRKATGLIKGVDNVRFSYAGGAPGGDVAGVTVELTHSDNDVLAAASRELVAILATYQGVVDIENSFESGSQQVAVTLNPRGQLLGLTQRGLIQQVNDAFHGVRALRQQRGSEEVDVMVMLSESETRSVYHLETLPIRIGDGQYVPLLEVAQISYGQSPSKILRRDGAKRISVSADVTPASEAMNTAATIQAEVFPQLAATYPNLTMGFRGDQVEQKESLDSLFYNGLLLLLALYCLLAIPFGSYSQPLLVMAVIPFGFVGGLLGHVWLGEALSVVSLLGILALSGVVINDSLILIVEVNRRIAQGQAVYQAIIDGACRRFRPIVLTTLTTFCGLAPMILETSNQAKLMIPMAISLGFGIVFATFITLILLPCLYQILQDLKGLAGQYQQWQHSER